MRLNLFLGPMSWFFGLTIAIQNDLLNTLPYTVHDCIKLRAFLVRVLVTAEDKNKQRRPSTYWNQKVATR